MISMCAKKDRIIELLKRSGMEADEAIATELEIGKLSMVGCTTYRDETNKVLMEIFRGPPPSSPEVARYVAKAINEVLNAEKSARRSQDVINTRFYQRLSAARKVRR